MSVSRFPGAAFDGRSRNSKYYCRNISCKEIELMYDHHSRQCLTNELDKQLVFASASASADCLQPANAVWTKPRRLALRRITKCFVGRRNA